MFSHIDDFAARMRGIPARARALREGIGLAQVRAAIRSPLDERRIGRQIAKAPDKPWMMFDLDETLTYRRAAKDQALPAAFAKGETPTIRSWLPWERQLRHDVIDPEMAQTFRRYKDTHNVGILTARSERSRGLTSRFLKRNELTPDALIMRPISRNLENMPSGEYKTTMLERHGLRGRISGFYDDSSSVLKAMETQGIQTHRVTPKELPQLEVSKLSSARRSHMARQNVGGYIDDPAATDPVNFRRRRR